MCRVRERVLWGVGGGFRVLSGGINYSHTYIRTRSHGNRYTYDGPDLWGNAIAYGRALYTSQHHVSEAFKFKGREFIIDRDYTLAVAWKLHSGDRCGGSRSGGCRG